MREATRAGPQSGCLTKGFIFVVTGEAAFAGRGRGDGKAEEENGEGEEAGDGQGEEAGT